MVERAAMAHLRWTAVVVRKGGGGVRFMTPMSRSRMPCEGELSKREREANIL